MANVPSQHTSQITFKPEDDVFHVPANTPAAEPSKTSVKGKKSSSKSSLKSSSKKGKSSDQGPVTSTPKSSKHKSVDHLDVSAIEPIQAESGNYEPSPYIFRSPNADFVKEVKMVPTKCPPYTIQLDHTLAVIWILFSAADARQPLGIVQLQWAHSFLQGIYNRKGEHPKDIALCLQTIEDELIEQYADMVDEVQYVKKKADGTPDVHEKTKASKDKKSKSKKPHGTRSEGEIPDVEVEEVEIHREPEKESGGVCYNTTCPNMVCTEGKSNAMTTKRVPFSINYAEMIRRTPPEVEQLYPSVRGSKTSSQGSGTRKSTSAVGTSVSRDNMMEFLKAWRREQVEKIQSELKRLKSIETFIGSAETENFSPYLDEQQLATLVAQKASSQKDKSKSKHGESKHGESKHGESKHGASKHGES